MIETSEIKALIHRVSQKRHGHRDRKIMHPNREWFMIVISFFVLLVGGVGFGVWYYQWYSSLPDRITVVEESALPHYNTDLVSQVITVYTDRSERFLEKLAQGGDIATNSEETVLPDGINGLEILDDVIRSDEHSDATTSDEIIFDEIETESVSEVESVDDGEAVPVFD